MDNETNGAGAGGGAQNGATDAQGVGNTPVANASDGVDSAADQPQGNGQGGTDNQPHNNAASPPPNDAGAAPDGGAADADRLAALEQRERDMAERDAALTRQLMGYKAKEMLAAKGLPAALHPLVAGADERDTVGRFNTLEPIFRAAVQEMVNDRLKSPPPGTGKAASGFEGNGAEAVQGIMRK